MQVDFNWSILNYINYMRLEAFQYYLSQICFLRDLQLFWWDFINEPAEVFRFLFYDNLLSCENPYHKQHLKRFLKKYPTADKKGEFAIITVNPEDWAVDLEDPKKNTVRCCQMCSIQEDIQRVSSPGWTGQPASYNPFEWKVRY